jgi:hypothetical protein
VKGRGEREREGVWRSRDWIGLDKLDWGFS